MGLEAALPTLGTTDFSELLTGPWVFAALPPAAKAVLKLIGMGGKLKDKM